jgi:hypothetical protein
MGKTKAKLGKDRKLDKKAGKRALAKDPRTPLRPPRESALEGAQRSAQLTESLALLENSELGDVLAAAIWAKFDADRAAMMAPKAPMTLSDFLKA